MAREFRLDLKVTLPEGDFEDAAAMVALAPVVEALEESVRKIGGDAVSISYGAVTPKPRGAKGDDAA